MSTKTETYDAQLAAWKERHGVTSGACEEVDHEALMVADDAKRKGSDYCIHCAERFQIRDMQLITRSDDPYVQFEDEAEPEDGREWYIKVKLRVRMCKPCYRVEYETLEDEDGESENDQAQPPKVG